MFKLSKEAKVGITVLVGFFILIWGLNFLKGKGIFSGGDRYYGLYNRVDGLTEASPILYKGFKVGAVHSVDFSDDRKNIVVGMSMYTDIVLPKNTIAQIYSLDLMGSKGIRLIYGDSDLILEPGDTLQTSLVGDLADKVSQEVLPLKNKAENLVVKIDSLLTNINSLFDAQNKANITSALSSFEATMKNLEGVSGEVNKSLSVNGPLGRSMANVDSITCALKQNADVLSSIMGNLEGITGQLNDTQIDSIADGMNQALVTFNSVLEGINEGEGSVGKLLKDEQLYYNLNEASMNLDRLLADVRHNPSRYVRFSAVSFGGGSSSGDSESKVVYKVQIEKSKNPSDLRGKKVLEERYTVNEDRHGKYFIYTIAEESDYNKIEEIHRLTAIDFPNAEIIALDNGVPIKVSKTLK